MSNVLDVISPLYIGQDKIVISVDPSSQPLLTSSLITLNFDYSATAPGGVVKPLKLQVQPSFGNGEGYFEVTFDLFTPDSYTFQAGGAGDYLAVIKEIGHNSWQGRLLFTVKGDPFTQVGSARS